MAGTKRGGERGGGRKARKQGIGKAAPAIRASVFVFNPPFSQLIKTCQMSIRDQSQVGGFSAW